MPYPAPVGTAAESNNERTAADEALQQAMVAAEADQLTAALLLHTAACPELVAEARALRNQLRHQNKKTRLKAKKVAASIKALQVAIAGGTDVEALVLAIGIAEQLPQVMWSADDKHELDTLLPAARVRLQRAREEAMAAQKAAAIETVECEFVALAMSHGACAEAGEQLGVCDVLDDEDLCVVCLSENKEICLVPCGHVCVCPSLQMFCSRKLRGCVLFAGVF